MATTLDLSIAIFAVALLGTFVVSYLGRQHARRMEAGALAGQRLNKWLVGLSAGATANSGFVVTGAVGLGYTMGAQWLVLPLAWLLGDVVFWSIFPNRINDAGRTATASTLTDVVVHGLAPGYRRGLKVLVAVIVLTCLGGYVSAQWLAGQKFLQGAFDFGSTLSLVVFAALIVVYTSLGGFRGSVYADTLQAVIRVVGTVIAMSAAAVVASRNSDLFWHNIETAGPGFLQLFPQHSLFAGVMAVAGFAAASIGFGLGQPQMVTRYLAGASPTETRSAWWIYMGFVQSTWIAMTVFGMMLRGIMPSIADPETGLSLFHRSTTGPVITGIIVADIFATIAATSNSLLVAMAQTWKFDLLGRPSMRQGLQQELWQPVAFLGALTMAVSMTLHTTVVNLALTSVSLMGAGLAPAMMVRVLGWRHSGRSLVLAVLVGIATAALWRMQGLGGTLNEAAPGIMAGLLVNALFAPRSGQTSASRTLVHDVAVHVGE
jgi:Na+/proline symporter